MYKTEKKVKNGLLYVGKIYENSRYNVIQAEDGLLLVFEANGLYRARHGYALISKYLDAYTFKAGSRVGNYMTASDRSSIKILGVRKYIVNDYDKACFDLPMPIFENMGEKSSGTSLILSSLVKDNVIELFKYDDFQCVVVRDHTDMVLPTYSELTQVFGAFLGHLGKASIKFRHSPNMPNPASLINLKQTEGYTYRNKENEDLVFTKQSNETRLFRNLDLPEYQETALLPDSGATELLKALSETSRTIERMQAAPSATAALEARMNAIEQQIEKLIKLSELR